MARPSRHDIYFSYFMFTANLEPDDRERTDVIARHMRMLLDLGYDGFDLPIAPKDTRDHAAEVASYVGLKDALDEAGLRDVPFTTNVGAWKDFNPASSDPEQRAAGLAYLKSRVDITEALGGKIMAGPIIFPYGLFPTNEGKPIWSDALQDWAMPGYRDAAPVLEELGEYAARKGIKLAIEPVDHWETAAPNLVSDVMRFLRHVKSHQLGVCVDSAHVVLGSDGRGAFHADMSRALATKRLHYVHLSAPDRGALHDSWIPWGQFLKPILTGYDGPFLVEVFNAVEPFPDLLRITRRKFWIPGEDTPVPGWPSAYDIAREGLAIVRRKLSELVIG